MFISQRRQIGLIVPIVMAAVASFSSAALAQETGTSKIVYAAPAPTLEVVAEPTVVTARRGDSTVSPKVHLTAKTTSSGTDGLRFKWSASGGRIEGNGAYAIWDLSGLQPGYYKAFVEASGGSDKDTCTVFSSTTVLVNSAPLVCPTIVISCPNKVVIDQPVVFSATAVGGSDNAKPGYNWLISGGRIIEGAGTSAIKVDTKGLEGQTVTATLSMSGYGLDCPASCSVQIPLPRILSRRFDQFPDIARNDEKARLDNLVIELQNDPTATAYIIVYPERRGRPEQISKHSKRILDYLVNSRGINAERIVTLVGPPHEDLMVELWITPQGAIPPKP